MNDHGLLFMGEMVRAFLRPVDPKRQTRRLVTPRNSIIDGISASTKQGLDLWAQIDWATARTTTPPFTAPRFFVDTKGGEKVFDITPRIQAGDTWWGKETHAEVGGCDPGLIVFRADYPGCVPLGYENIPPAEEIRWTSSILMPRRVSRLKGVTRSVRAEVGPFMTEADAIAEGLSKISKDDGRTWKYGIPDRDGLPGVDDTGWPWHEWRLKASDAYVTLWNKINTKPGTQWGAPRWAYTLALNP